MEVNLPRQLDQYVWFERTTSMRPLVAKPRSGPAETYPFGI